MKVKVAQSCPTLCDPMDYTVHGILQARIMEWVTFPSPGHLPNPGTKPRSPTLQAHSLPAEPQRKPKNTGVDSLSLLQWIFLTQELNRGLLHCRWILYQLSSHFVFFNTGKYMSVRHQGWWQDSSFQENLAFVHLTVTQRFSS